MYDRIGKAALRFTVTYLRRRYRRQIRIALGLGAASLGLAAYWASRNVPEG